MKTFLFFRLPILLILFLPKVLYGQNTVTIGSETLNEKAVLMLVSPTGNQGLILPRVTNKEVTAPSGNEKGMVVYDDSDDKIYFWNGSSWIDLAGGGHVTELSLSELNDVNTAGASVGQVLKWNGSNWRPAIDESGGSGGGTDSQQLTFDNTTKILSIENGNGIDLSSLIGLGDDWGAKVVDHDGSLKGDGASGSPLGLSGQGANAGEVLKWDGDEWLPAVDNVGSGSTTYTAGDGISINGSNEISNTGDADADPTNEIQDITFDPATNELSISSGSSVVLPSGSTDADADPANEIQNLSLSGTNLQISDGAGVDLAAVIPGTDETTNTGILIGDGSAVTGLIGTADGQIPRWDNGTSSWVAGTISGGSSLWSENTGNLYYNSGKVGIGTDVPGGQLDVVTDGSLINGLRVSATTSSTVGASIYMNALNKDWTITATNDATGYLEDKFIIRDYTLGTNRFIIDGDGNIGIGNERPTAKLDVAGNIRSSELAGSGERNVVADPDGNLIIGAGSSGSSSLWSEYEANIYYDAGNVGIGINSPETKLHVLSNDFSGSTAKFESTTGANYLTFFNHEGYKGYAGIWTGSNDMDFGTGASNTTGKVHLTTLASPKLTVVPNGNVGIGTEVPTAKLDVIGDVKTSGEVQRPSTGAANLVPIAYGSISVDGTISSGSGNFTAVKFGTGRYHITINDESYFIGNYSTIASAVSSGPALISTSSGIGNLQIYIYDLSGVAIDKSFSFVTYKR